MNKLVELASLKHKEKLMMNYQGKSYYGANQNWFNKHVQVAGGCGTICGFNLLYYRQGASYKSDIDLVKAMDETYYLMKPGELEHKVPQAFISKKWLPPSIGIYSISHFNRRIKNMSKAKNLGIKSDNYRLRGDQQLDESVQYIKSQLLNDKQVFAFNTYRKSILYVHGTLINTAKEEVKREEDILKLRSQKFITHWVMITGLYQVESSHNFYIECTTWGKVAYINLNELCQQKSLKSMIFQAGYVSLS